MQTLKIVVTSKSALDTLLKAVWGDFTSMLAAGNRYDALKAMPLAAQLRYRDVFDTLAPFLPQIVANWSAPKTGRLSESIGEYTISRTIDGVKRLFFVYLVRDDDGIWRPETM